MKTWMPYSDRLRSGTRVRPGRRASTPSLDAVGHRVRPGPRAAAVGKPRGDGAEVRPDRPLPAGHGGLAGLGSSMVDETKIGAGRAGPAGGQAKSKKGLTAHRGRGARHGEGDRPARGSGGLADGSAESLRRGFVATGGTVLRGSWRGWRAVRAGQHVTDGGRAIAGWTLVGLGVTPAIRRPASAPPVPAAPARPSAGRPRRLRWQRMVAGHPPGGASVGDDGSGRPTPWDGLNE